MDDGESANRRAGSGRKTVVDYDSLRDAIRSSLSTSMRQHSSKFRVGAATVRRAVAKLGFKSRVIVKRPWTIVKRPYAPSTLNVARCSLKTSSLLRLEVTWTVDPVGSRMNDCYLSLGVENESARTLLKIKHPASVMSLGFVASNGAVMPLIWFLSGYRQTARDYKAKLANKLVPRIINTFDISSVTVALQQDGAPAHTSNRVQHIL